MSKWRERVADVRYDEQALYMAMAHELDKLEAERNVYRIFVAIATVTFMVSTYIP